MRNLKKILAMALTVLMVVGSFAMTATAAFDDVTDYQEAIDVMYELGIAKGISDTEFAPDESVTREQMALWIAKIMTGKVDDTYVTNNFLGAVENLTAFADLEEENYVGAINYAANNGIIVGTSATTFEATEAIKIQDVFAMVVRMLGYGSTAMNNNYPWSFIDKAISLGLDADLPADYSNEAEATRGETMQILFNALTALKSDGSTLGYDFFGLEKATVVITGTAEGNMYTGADLVTKTVDDEDYVSFSILNANGTVAADNATYYILKSAFGIDKEADAQFYVGNSYVVRTVDGFASFLTIEEATTPVVVDQDVVVGGTSTASTQKYVTVDGTKYTLVDSFSDFVKSNDTEIIVVRPDGKRTEVYDAASYVMDADLNIIGQNGEVLLYWVTTQGVGLNTPAYANLNGMYLYKISEDNYIQPNDYIWSLAKKVSINTADAYGFEAADNSYKDIEQYDAYSDTVLYDDDNDGDYDRAIYVQYKFGRLTDDGSTTVAGVKYPLIRYQTTKTQTTDGGAQAYAGNLDERSSSTDKAVLESIAPAKTKVYYNGEAIDFADIDGKFVLYTYIPLYKTIIVKDILEEQTGLVTGIDLVNNTITLNAFGANIIGGIVTGETYKLGNAKLLGATVTDIKAFGGELLTNIIGKNIKFVEKDGAILAVYNAIDDAKHMVYVNSQPGYTTMGYNNILAYYDAASSKIASTQSVVTVNAQNNYWYGGYVNSAVTGYGRAFTNGDFLAATKDSHGNYDVTVATPNYTYVDDEDQTVDRAKEIKISNGIIYSTDIDDFGTWQVNANTVFIVKNSADVNKFDYEAMTGIPASGAVIKINEGGKVYFENSGAENFVYVFNGDFDGSITGADTNPWGGINANSTIIYVTADTVATTIANNAYGYNMMPGTHYTYTNAFDIINGKQANNIFTDYNFYGMLEKGSFYKVENGYVVAKIDPTAYEANGIYTGILMNADSDGKADAKEDLAFIDSDKKERGQYDISRTVENLYGYDLIIDIDETQKNYINYKEYKYPDTDRKTVNNVLPKLYWNNATNDMYKFVDALVSHSGSASDNVAAKAVYDTLNNAFTATKDSDGYVTALNDNQGLVVYYYGDVNGMPVGTAPAFIAKSTAAYTVIEYNKAAADKEAADAEAKQELDDAIEESKLALHVYGWDEWNNNASQITAFIASDDIMIFEDSAFKTEFAFNADKMVNGAESFLYKKAETAEGCTKTFYIAVKDLETTNFTYELKARLIKKVYEGSNVIQTEVDKAITPLNEYSTLTGYQLFKVTVDVNDCYTVPATAAAVANSAIHLVFYLEATAK